MRLWAAIMIDFIPEAQTLLMVVAGVPRVKPEETTTETRGHVNKLLLLLIILYNL